MAYPFPNQEVRADSCAVLTGRKMACAGPWERRERGVAGAVLAVVAVLAVAKVLGWVWVLSRDAGDEKRVEEVGGRISEIEDGPDGLEGVHEGPSVMATKGRNGFNARDGEVVGERTPLLVEGSPWVEESSVRDMDRHYSPLPRE